MKRGARRALGRATDLVVGVALFAATALTVSALLHLLGVRILPAIKLIDL